MGLRRSSVGFEFSVITPEARVLPGEIRKELAQVALKQDITGDIATPVDVVSPEVMRDEPSVTTREIAERAMLGSLDRIPRLIALGPIVEISAVEDPEVRETLQRMADGRRARHEWLQKHYLESSRHAPLPTHRIS